MERGFLAAWCAPAIPYLAVLIGLYGLRNAWVAVLGYHLGMVVILALEKKWLRVHALGEGSVRWQLAVALLSGVGVGIAFYLCWPLFGVSGEIGARLAQVCVTPAAWPAFILYFVLVNPVLEELFWRGHLASTSRRIIWQDVLFAGYHLLVMAYFVRWPWLLVALLALTATAWLWRQLAHRNNGLLVPFVAHAAADAGIMAAVYVISLR